MPDLTPDTLATAHEAALALLNHVKDPCSAAAGTRSAWRKWGW